MLLAWKPSLICLGTSVVQGRRAISIKIHILKSISETSSVSIFCFYEEERKLTIAYVAGLDVFAFDGYAISFLHLSILSSW